MRRATLLSLLLTPGLASAGSAQTLDLTAHPVGTAALAIFVLAYLAVVAEEFTKLRKSKPVILAAGVIWALIGAVYTTRGISDSAAAALRHNLLEYAEMGYPLRSRSATLQAWYGRALLIPPGVSIIRGRCRNSTSGFRRRKRVPRTWSSCDGRMALYAHPAVAQRGG